ncbi:hypothetical protein BH23CHL7_BH23CHL7_03760 [soil metagenome]
MASDQPADEPAGEPTDWDLDWEPTEKGAGAPAELPPDRGAVYAEFPLRALAFVIDFVLAFVVGQFSSSALGLIAAWLNRQPGATPDNSLLLASSSHAVLSIIFTLAFLYLWRAFRATPGQMALHLMIVRADTGEPLSRGRMILRWLLVYLPLAPLMSYQTLGTALARIPATAQVDQFLIAGAALLLPLIWWFVLALSIGFDRRRGRGLHDRLAGSVVVRRL